MKFIHLEMHGFRAYREATGIDFEPGLNVFRGDNEAGKSSILRAIKASLFPPRSAPDRNACVSEGSDICRIGLEYELVAGERFRVERDLVEGQQALNAIENGKARTLATGSSEVAGLLQEQLSCDESLFTRTLMVGHEDLQLASGDELTRAMSVRIESLIGGAGKVPADKAVRRIDEVAKKLTGPRVGDIVVVEQQLAEAQVRLQRAQEQAGRLTECQRELERLETELVTLHREQQELSEGLKQARVVADLEQRKTTVDEHLDLIERSVAARDELAALEQGAAAARAMVSAQIRAETMTVRARIPIPMMIISILLVLGGGGSIYVGQKLLGGLLIGIGVILVATTVAVRIRAATIRRAAIRQEVEQRVVEFETKREQARGQVQALLKGSDKDLQERRRDMSRTQRELEAEIIRLEEFRIPQAELDARESRLGELPALVVEAERNRGGLQQETQSLSAGAAAAPDIEDEIGVMEQRLERLKTRADALRLAQQELSATIDGFRQAIGPRIAADATRRLQLVVPEYAVGLVPDGGLTFRPTRPDGQAFDRLELSDGTDDQFFFALRVALSDVLFSENMLPLLLDDPFRYSDQRRKIELHSMLQDMARMRQVLYFTLDEPEGLQVTHQLPLAGARR
jgi:hypothetical protein